MERELVSEQIDALRVEALEARRLAETLGDTQSILDLENYAAQLEAEADHLRSKDRVPDRRGRGRALLITDDLR